MRGKMIRKKDRQMFLSFFGLIRPFTLLAPFTVSLSIMVASFYYHGGEFSIDIFFQIIIKKLYLTISSEKIHLKMAIQYSPDLSLF